MRINNIFIRLSVLTFLTWFAGCSGKEKLTVNPKNGLLKSDIQLTRNGQKIINVSTADCELAGGYVAQDVNGIILKTTDVESMVTIQLYIYYNTLSDLVTNKVMPIIDVSDYNDLKPVCLGHVMFLNSQQQYYTSRGSLTLTAFDKSTGYASCQFSFTGTDLTGSKATFSGSFSNVPIYPDEDAFGNCAQSVPGLGNGTLTNPITTPTGEKTTVSFENTTFTPIEISLGGVNQTIQPAQKVTFQAKAGTQATFNATTSGKTSSGDIVGLKMEWSNSSVTFPTSGTSNVPLAVSGNYFFIMVRNNSVRKINRVLVNYQLQSGTTENLLITNDKQLYKLGYYKAFSNSNVRLENTDVNWNWSYSSSVLALSFKNNQSVTLNAN